MRQTLCQTLVTIYDLLFCRLLLLCSQHPACWPWALRCMTGGLTQRPTSDGIAVSCTAPRTGQTFLSWPPLTCMAPWLCRRVVEKTNVKSEVFCECWQSSCVAMC